jgi:hypothetical protein
MNASVETPPAAGAARTIAGFIEDTVLLLLVLVMIPATILLIGAPIALLIRAVIELAARF